MGWGLRKGYGGSGFLVRWWRLLSAWGEGCVWGCVCVCVQRGVVVGLGVKGRAFAERIGAGKKTGASGDRLHLLGVGGVGIVSGFSSLGEMGGVGSGVVSDIPANCVTMLGFSGVLNDSCGFALT